jgi:hypothetical protein
MECWNHESGNLEEYIEWFSALSHRSNMPNETICQGNLAMVLVSSMCYIVRIVIFYLT